MNTLKTVFREVLGLFVDDSVFALSILLWLTLLWLLAMRLHAGLATGVLLFAGLAAVLLESALRFARKSARLSIGSSILSARPFQ